MGPSAATASERRICLLRHSAQLSKNNLPDFGKGILSAVDGTHHIKYLFAPSGDKIDVRFHKVQRGLSVTGKVEEVELRLRILGLVLVPVIVDGLFVVVLSAKMALQISVGPFSLKNPKKYPTFGD